MLRHQRVDETYASYVDQRTSEELFIELLTRGKIESLKDSLLEMEMNTKFKKLKEKTDYSKQHLLMDLSVLLDSSSPKLLDELHSSEIISIVHKDKKKADRVYKIGIHTFPETTKD